MLKHYKNNRRLFFSRLIKYSRVFHKIKDNDAFCRYIEHEIQTKCIYYEKDFFLTENFLLGRTNVLLDFHCDIFMPLAIPKASISMIHFYYLPFHYEGRNRANNLPTGCFNCRLHNGMEANFFVRGKSAWKRCNDILNVLYQQKYPYIWEETTYPLHYNLIVKGYRNSDVFYKSRSIAKENGVKILNFSEKLYNPYPHA